MRVIINIETKEAANATQEALFKSMENALVNCISAAVSDIVQSTRPAVDLFEGYTVTIDEGVSYFEINSSEDFDKQALAEHLSEALAYDVQYVAVLDKFIINRNPVNTNLAFKITQNIPVGKSIKILCIDPVTGLSNPQELAGLGKE